MKQHILGLTLASLLTPPANAEDVRLSFELDFETLEDCQEAVETLEIIYQRFDGKPLGICKTSGEVSHLSHPEVEDGEDTHSRPPAQSDPSSPTPELLPFERSA